MTKTPKPYGQRDQTTMTAPQSTWCAGSCPCFRAGCESGWARRGLRRQTDTTDGYVLCMDCTAVHELVVDGRAQL
jgi:hypothetical protein